MSYSDSEGSCAHTRRAFLSSSMALVAAASSQTVSAEPILANKPTHARRRSLPDKVNVAVVGVGGRGADNIQDLRDTMANIVALCDCDESRASRTFADYPAARRFSDWRRLFEVEKTFDAVLVATPDHNHAIISITAMKLGKHVYSEKPLTRSIWEAREMSRIAREKGVATQMGTQGHAFEGTRSAVEVLRSGVIGEVREIHVWTDRPAGWWNQGVSRSGETPQIPQGLDWDVWLGPAPLRPYHPDYVPFKWRGFWDFGTGAIGDMGIHNLDTAYWGLDLGIPTLVEVRECSPMLGSREMMETAPLSSIIDIHFPSRGRKPAVKMTWYDGGKLPPTELFLGEPMISKDGGSLVVGSKGTLFTRTWHGGHSKDDMFVLLPRKDFSSFVLPEPRIPRVKSHHHEWIDVCRGEGKTESPFSYAARLTESLLLGNVALRTGKRIEWDARAMRAIGCKEADQYIRPSYRRGWSL